MPFVNKDLVPGLQPPRKTEGKVAIRREKVKHLLMCGHPSQQEIADELKVSITTIKSDMAAIEGTELEYLKKQNAEYLLNDFRLQSDGAYQEAWKVYKKYKHPNIKLGALKLIKEFLADKIKISQSLGIIREVAPAQREPLKIEFVKPEWMKKSEENGSASDNDKIQPVEQAAGVSQKAD